MKAWSRFLRVMLRTLRGDRLREEEWRRVPEPNWRCRRAMHGKSDYL
jgi:hypothetical protein